MPSTAIISELYPISKFVAEIPCTTPYTIPENYFQSLADDILYRITVIESSVIDPAVLQLTDKNIPYQVPPGYFNNLAGTILDRIKASGILSSQEEMETLSPLLSKIDKKMPLSIPANYFEELRMPVATSETGDAEIQVSSLLQSARTLPTYQLPPDYFIHLSESILAKVTTTNKAKVVSMTFTRKLTRYAVAASVACVVAVSGWFYMRNTSGVKPSGTEMADIKNISSKELQDFVDKNTVILPEENTVTSEDMSPEDIKIMLAGVSDEELQQYVDQQPLLKEPALKYFN